MSAAEGVVQTMFIKPEYQALVTALYNKLKGKAQDLLKNGVDLSNILLLTDLAMKEVGKMKLVGFEKKALVITVVQKLAEDTLNELKKASETAGEAAEDVANRLQAELNDLQVVINKALDPFIDQLFSLAPKVYGDVKKSCFCCC